MSGPFSGEGRCCLHETMRDNACAPNHGALQLFRVEARDAAILVIAVVIDVPEWLAAEEERRFCGRLPGRAIALRTSHSRRPNRRHVPTHPAACAADRIGRHAVRAPMTRARHSP